MRGIATIFCSHDKIFWAFRDFSCLLPFLFLLQQMVSLASWGVTTHGSLRSSRPKVAAMPMSRPSSCADVQLHKKTKLVDLLPLLGMATWLNTPVQTWINTSQTGFSAWVVIADCLVVAAIRSRQLMHTLTVTYIDMVLWCTSTPGVFVLYACICVCMPVWLVHIFAFTYHAHMYKLTHVQDTVT